MSSVSLPIEPLLPRIADTLASSARLVLVAPPGAGKTTLVPPALVGAPWLRDRKIVMLEPRRLAARAAARRMASLAGERVGDTYGYRVHLDTVVGPRTRVEVVTEGVLTRMLQSDPTLDGIGMVIFDEFHERSLHADLGLALTLHTQRVLRDDLRIVAMSATLDGASVARIIDAPLIESAGRVFPVSTEYRPRRDREYVEQATARVVREAMLEHDGDVLVFLPGGAEIRRVHDTLRDDAPPLVDVRPLYGDLPGDAQDAAIAPSAAGRRKIVLATNIAETSLTIEGVRVVIDSGLARVPRFSPRTGLTRLETARISRASADQRRGRAGRTAPGACYRLWSEGDDAQLAPRQAPEILEADLASLALELAAAGIDDPLALTWIDPPPAGALAQSRALLVQLGALTDAFAPTTHGRAMASYATHPRLAHMLVRGREAGHGALACALAALLSNRDIVHVPRGEQPDADLSSRLEILENTRAESASRVNRDALASVRRDQRAWRDKLGITDTRMDHAMAGVVLAFAYPDRIARRRNADAGRYVMRNGTGAHFAVAQPLGAEEWLVIAETDGRVPESRIFLAAPAALDALVTHGAASVTVADDVRWDDRTERVIAIRRSTVGAITVKEQTLTDPAPELIRAAMLNAVRRAGINALPWSDAARALRERLAFLRTQSADAPAQATAWPDVSSDILLASLEEWLSPAIGDARTLRDIARADLSEALLSRLDWKQRAQLDELAPTHVDVPSGSRIRVDYSDPRAPSIAVRLQELYGTSTTPSVLGGRVPLTLHLLSPARRPVQVTSDLAAFWRGSYAEVRKDMRGRYPKHDWPLDPENGGGRRKGGEGRS